MVAMPQRTLRTFIAACTLAAALLLALPGPVHAAPGMVTVDGWTVVWKWMWRMWGGGTAKSGSLIDPNGTPVPSGSGIDPNGGTALDGSSNSDVGRVQAESGPK
jgi:hypothetical protein